MKIRNLPLWGKRVELEDINFEWPQNSLVKTLSLDTYLKSLKVKSSCDSGSISSVCCTLSNGKTSSVFEKSGHDHTNEKTIEFDPSTPIRAVVASDCNQQNQYCW